MGLKLETLCEFIEIYDLQNMLTKVKIATTLYYSDTKFTIKFEDYPNLKVEQVKGKLLKYTNHTRYVANLTASKCFERLMSIIGGIDKNEQETSQTALK